MMTPRRKQRCRGEFGRYLRGGEAIQVSGFSCLRSFRTTSPTREQPYSHRSRDLQKEVSSALTKGFCNNQTTCRGGPDQPLRQGSHQEPQRRESATLQRLPAVHGGHATASGGPTEPYTHRAFLNGSSGVCKNQATDVASRHHSSEEVTAWNRRQAGTWQMHSQ